MVEAWVEAPDDVLHEVGVGDGRAEIAELIDHCLHLGALRQHGQIALEEGTKFRVEVDESRGSVVAEEIMNAPPQRVRRVVVGGDGGEEIRGKAIVEPGQDGTISQDPIGVALWSSSAVDVIAEAVLAEDGGERAYPGGVVGLVEIQHNGHTRLNVDAMNDGRGSWYGGDAQRVGNVAGIVGGGGGGHGGSGGGAEKFRIADRLIPCKQ